MNKTYLFVSWFIALAAMLGSLYYSEIKGLVPCVLCWYQRILFYPLVAILAVGIIRRDRGVPFYVLPLSIIGIGVALFQWLLQLGVIPEQAAPCTLGVSCVTKYVEYFGFITIPFLSLVAFIATTIMMLLTLRKK